MLMLFEEIEYKLSEYIEKKVEMKTSILLGENKCIQILFLSSSMIGA